MILRWILRFLSLLPAAWLATFAVLYAHNSLYYGREWIVEKRRVHVGIMGANEFLMTRYPLAGGVLHLGQYHGFQWITSYRTFQPQEISADFELPHPAGYIDVVFGNNGDSHSALRLSRNPQIPSLFYQANRDGKFLERKTLRTPELGEGWHKLTLTDQGSELRLDLDGQVMSFTGSFVTGAVGLKSSMHDANIRKISVTDVGGLKTEYDFFPRLHALRLFTIHLMVLVLGALAFSTAVGFRSARRRFTAWLAFGVISAACLSIWCAFDFFYYSHGVHNENGFTRVLHQESKTRASVEAWRVDLFAKWYTFWGGEPTYAKGLEQRGYPLASPVEPVLYCGPQYPNCRSVALNSITSKGTAPLKPSYRVLITGSSQTLGVGANRLEDTFVHRLFKRERARLPSKIPFELVRMAYPGRNTHGILQDYEALALEFKPDLAVINLVNNDPVEGYEDGLQKYLEFNRRNGIRTVLLREPNSPELLNRDAIRAKYEIQAKLGEEFAAPIWAIDEYLSRPEIAESGILWWDLVHLTSHGQDLMADWLVLRIDAELKLKTPGGVGMTSALGER